MKVVKTIKTHIAQFFSKNHAVYKIMKKNMVQITEHTKDAICLPNNQGKNTDTYSHILY